MKNDIIRLLAVFNVIIYTSLGFQAVNFGYTVIFFLIIPVVAFSFTLMVNK